MTERRIQVLERFAALMRAGPFDMLVLSGVTEDSIHYVLNQFDEDCPWEIDLIEDFIKTIIPPAQELKKLLSWWDEMTWANLERDPDPVDEVKRKRKLKRGLRAMWKQAPKIKTERMRRKVKE